MKLQWTAAARRVGEKRRAWKLSRCLRSVPRHVRPFRVVTRISRDTPDRQVDELDAFDPRSTGTGSGQTIVGFRPGANLQNHKYGAGSDKAEFRGHVCISRLEIDHRV